MCPGIIFNTINTDSGIVLKAMDTQKTQVLIIGAGPTGLVLALWLTKIGVHLRIIDKAERAGTTSRAIVIHARNLEFYRQLGIAEIAVEKGIEIKAGNLWKRGKKVGHLPLSD